MDNQSNILHSMFTAVYILKKGFAEFVSEYDLTEMEAKFIFHMGGKKHKTCDLIDFFKKHKSTIRQKTRALEKKGFITIECGEEDKRERHINLTPKGEDFYKKIKNVQRKYYKDVFSKFTKEEENELHILLNKLEINKENDHEVC